ncbi:MAG: KpsF/GutQ family sugar-phosphate isomerase [Deltaproteobacteria bacterium]|nr:KpsF/GutQ family sugar-phosphate isomerase [Deltaproteobacteria bacterium]
MGSILEREEILKAREVLAIEASALGEVAERIDASFSRAVDLIVRLTDPTEKRGHLIVMGVGKSGLIGRKIAATFASTGTPSFFVHPTEALHGDLGMVSEGDVVLALSNSGEVEELTALIPTLKMRRIPLIVMTGNPRSTLAKQGDVILNVAVSKEACPLRLAPTASTTAALAMGDALAMVLMEKRGFTREEYARLHPGGKLGSRLKKVADLMLTGDRIPVVSEETPMAQVLFEISSKRLGVTAVLDQKNQLAGVITDGDIRRWLERKGDIHASAARDAMTPSPKTITPEVYAGEALNLMESYAITSFLVVSPEKSGELIGIIHMHDLIAAKVA